VGNGLASTRETGNDGLSRRGAVVAFVALAAVAFAIHAPIMWSMVLHWNHKSEDYSHAFLIAPLAAFFAWERRRELRAAPVAPSWWGVLPLALGTLSLAIGRLGVELMTMRLAYPTILAGLVLLLLGRSIFRILLFPLLFLYLMVPLPQSVVNEIAFPLQLVASDLAVQALHQLGIPALREGNIIHLANARLFVAEACSGLRSLMSLVTLGVVFAYFFRKTWGERIVILLSTFPIAIGVNAFRVALTGVLTSAFGEGMAKGAIHETEGLFTFGIAFLGLLLEAWLLARIWPERWRAVPVRRRAA
jgi:exosortase